MEFDNIVLLPKEIHALKKLSRVDEINFGNSDLNVLLTNNLISQIIEDYDSNGFPLFYGKYRITDKGIRYLKYISQKRKEKISLELRGWITTVIAVAAFALSMISLIAQWKHWF